MWFFQKENNEEENDKENVTTESQISGALLSQTSQGLSLTIIFLKENFAWIVNIHMSGRLAFTPNFPIKSFGRMLNRFKWFF